MQYVVKGKVFAEEEEAKKYEKELEAKEIERKKKEDEKEKRIQELKEIEKEYVDKANKFYDDYGYYSVTLKGLKGIPCSFNSFFDDFDMFK